MLYLQELRKRSGLSVNQMCERLGVKPDRYYKWESERNEIPLDMACACADILHCSLDELIGHADRKSMPLSLDEEKLINAYRASDSRGKAAIMRTAEGEAGMGQGFAPDLDQAV